MSLFDRFVRIALIVIATFGGFYIQLGARLYIADVFMFCAFVPALVYCVRRCSRFIWLVILVMTGFAFYALLCDLSEGYAFSLIAKGMLRNLMLPVAVCVVCSIANAYGLIYALFIVVLLKFSRFLYGAYLEPYLLIDSFEAVLRVGGGSSLVYMVLFLMGFVRGLQSIGFLAAVVFYGVVYQFRSLAALHLLAPIGYFLRGFLSKIHISAIYFSALIAAVSVYAFWMFLIPSINIDSGEIGRYNRNMQSSDTRMDMNRHAFGGIWDAWGLGNGTDSHHRNYMAKNKSDEYLSVHSIVLQFGYEYGVIGLLFALSLLLFGFHVLATYIQQQFALDDLIRGHSCMFMVLMASVVYTMLFSPYASYARIGFSCSLGLVVCVYDLLVLNQKSRIRAGC